MPIWQNDLNILFKSFGFMLQEILLVLDGTTGLNMLPQAREFNEVTLPNPFAYLMHFTHLLEICKKDHTFNCKWLKLKLISYIRGHLV